jgi:hypothetical protein
MGRLLSACGLQGRCRCLRNHLAWLVQLRSSRVSTGTASTWCATTTGRHTCGLLARLNSRVGNRPEPSAQALGAAALLKPVGYTASYLACRCVVDGTSQAIESTSKNRKTFENTGWLKGVEGFGCTKRRDTSSFI